MITSRLAKTAWLNSRLVPSNQVNIHLSSVGVNYGAGVYDVMRCREVGGQAAVFRLDDHIDRFYYSASSLRMQLPVEKNQFKQAVIETVKANSMTEGEIRLLALCGFGRRGLFPPKSEVDTAIVLLPSTDLEPRDGYSVNVSQVIRPHPLSTVIDAKIIGHYASSILGVVDAAEMGVKSVVMLDWEGNVAEGPIANFFMVSDGTLFTPPSGRILPGMTRDTIIKLAQSMGIEVRQEFFKTDFLQKASEAFFTGTSLGVFPIAELEGRSLSSWADDSTTLCLREAWQKAVQGQLNLEDHPWITLL